MIFNNYIDAFLVWRKKKVNDQAYVIFLSALIGLISGLAAVVLKDSVHLIKKMLVHDIINELHTYLFMLYPLAGLLITYLVIKYLIRRQVADGVPTTLYAISKQNGIIKPHHTWSTIVTSAITVGFGGSVGLEGPAIATGSAIGSNISRILRLNYKTTILLIGCAASGAMGAIFNAPIAAIIFSLEVIMLDLTMSSLIPLLIASICASLTSYLFLGRDVLFHFTNTEVFLIKDIPFYILLGIISGFISLYFSKVHLFLSGQIKKIKNDYHRILICGMVLGVLIFMLPSLYGEGYESINSLLVGNFSVLLSNVQIYLFAKPTVFITFTFLLIILLKVVATSITLGGGGVGGLFAPSLFLGSCLGFLFSYVINISGITTLSATNYTLVGMAGIIAGVIHAPLTAIFLIAEITGGYQLFLPLMIVSAISYMTVRKFQPHSIYTIQLAKRGELITHHKDKAVLTLLKLEGVIEKNFVVVEPDNTLRDLVKAIKQSVRNIFPVVDKEGSFLGLIPLDNVRDIMFDTDSYDRVFIRDLMIDPPAVICLQDSMEDVMNKLKGTGLWNLPVVDNGKYLGFVSRANIFNAYRNLLIEVSED